VGGAPQEGLASRIWDNLLLAINGEQFMVSDEICGAVCSMRYQVPAGSRT